MATKQIKDYSQVGSPASGDFLITQQSVDSITRKITITQLISTVKGLANGLASLNASAKVVEQPASISDFLDNTAGGTDSETGKAPTSNAFYDHAQAVTGVHGVTGAVCSEAVADSKDTAAIAAHVALADPHTVYRLESSDHTHASSGAQGGVLGAAAVSSLFGAWDATKLINTAYQAATDGIVIGNTDEYDPSWVGYTDGSNPPTTVRARFGPIDGGGSSSSGIIMPVRKGDYWKITCDKAATLFWLPIGS